MSNERDELTELIYDRRFANVGEIVDDILAAGYRKPRTITTTDELDALPVGSIIRDPNGLALQLRLDGCWWVTNGDVGLGLDDISPEALPATVLWETTP